MAKQYSVESNGIQFEVEVSQNTSNGTITITFLKPPAIAGETHVVDADANDPITTGPITQNDETCNYRFEPEPPLNWEDVDKPGDLKITPLCQS